MRLSTTQIGKVLVALLLMVGFSSTALAQRTVTLQLNTASLSDTTSTSSLIEVRGAVDGTAPATLADGNVINWNEESTLEPVNIGGDYWEVSFQIDETSAMEFKYFSQQAEDSEAAIGGWEDGGNHMLPAGSNDTTFTVHFYEKGDDKPYDWRPFEAMEGHVGVWFRVFMNTEAAVNGGYDPEDMANTVGVRGDPRGGNGPLDWGATQLLLTQESDVSSVPGYHLWSGVAYFPDSLAGQVQEYKFIQEDTDENWESSDNRSFTIPASDTTLYWQYFSNDTPVSGVEQVTSTLLFAVDTTPLEAIGLYDRGRGDSLEVRGDFNGWGCGDPTICELIRVPGEDLFEGAFALTAFPETAWNYKFFINHNDENFVAEFGEDPPTGWEEPISTTGANRPLVFEGTTEQDLGVQFFNDVLSGNIVPEGNTITLNFQVRMDSAIVDQASPFDPATDSVSVEFGDPLWAFSQRLYRDSTGGGYPLNTSNILLTDDDGDGLYTGSIDVTGPTFGAIQYKYGFTGVNSGLEEGGGFSDAGRRRTRYIPANMDGSWPTEYTFEEEVYLPAGLLPFETNPVLTSVEDLGGELPTQARLEANYPNPFNPTTTIEYSIDTVDFVSLKVFDMTGRLVATLVDGIQQPSNYQVTFEANDLASGVYMYRLQAANTTITKKMILLK